jgi:hypothetical protein
MPPGAGHEVSIDSSDAPDIVKNHEAVAASCNHAAGFEHRVGPGQRNQLGKLRFAHETQGPYAHRGSYRFTLV